MSDRMTLAEKVEALHDLIGETLLGCLCNGNTESLRRLIGGLAKGSSEILRAEPADEEGECCMEGDGQPEGDGPPEEKADPTENEFAKAFAALFDLLEKTRPQYPFDVRFRANELIVQVYKDPGMILLRSKVDLAS